MTTPSNMQPRSGAPGASGTPGPSGTPGASGKPSGTPGPSSAPKRSPDITKCRAYSLGAGSLTYCLSEHRANCDYPLPFGIKYFCLHPQCMEIADRFRAGPSGSASVKFI